ncbi:MAG: hypothetical protein VX527_05470 [Planctomycetota bacterium]|nr:hypothetical protein [Planctomycetota bacterium]
MSFRILVVIMGIILITCFHGCSKPPAEDGSIRLHVADWVPAFGHNGGWRAVPTGKPLEGKADWPRSNEPHALQPGFYDVYWVQDYKHESEPMRIANKVLVESTKETTVNIDSGLRLDKADWVPKLGHEGWWGAVPVGKPVADRVDWAHENTALVIPPGRYDVYWVQDYKHENQPLRLATDVIVSSGNLAKVDAATGIRMDVAEWVPKIGHEGWWGAVPTGMTVEDRLDWAHENIAILLPPGNYDVYRVQDYKHEDTPVRLATEVVVVPASAATVTARSGIRLDVPDSVPDLGHNGWWGAVPAGRDVADRVDWAASKSTPLLLTPGNYDVYWRQDYNAQPKMVVKGAVVTSGELTVATPGF